jgi:tetratricopeptide (TPR) repeat protein
MASLIKGYEYDVFISYRQNDNKYDGWITAFVHNLILELEATIKDKVSVYFDINPRDGLLETYSVDKSLEEKIKCLIFIPIISKTYCDKQSFAWQHEFCEFNKFAREDKFGRDIKLGRGNFASRILPIKIHELNNEDNKILELELGGSLRSIDFIYKSAGVNRPLRAIEDHPHDNLNNTYYRDQINKVANAIYEILYVFKHELTINVEEEVTTKTESVISASKDEHKVMAKKRPFPIGNKLWVVAFELFIILAIFFKLIYPLIFKKAATQEQKLAGERISIAVMPFQNLTNDSTLNYLRIAGQEGVITNLSFYPEDFKVRASDLLRNFLKSKNISYFSSITAYTESIISKNLDADFLLLGDINKSGKVIRLNAKLLDSNTKEIIRPFMVEGITDNIMYKIDSLSEMVRKYLMISKIREKTIQPSLNNPYKLHYLTNSPDAFRYHYLALEAFYSLDYNSAIKLDSQAVVIDSNFIAATVTLCWENYGVGKFAEAKKWLLKAYNKRDKIPMINQIRLDYHYASLFQSPDEQIKYLMQLKKIEDNNPNYYLLLGYQYVTMYRYNESIPEFKSALEIYKKWDSEPNDIYYYHYLIRAYYKTGQNEKVKEFLQKAEKNFIKNNQGAKTGDQYLKMAVIYSDAGSYEKAEECFKKAIPLELGKSNISYLYASSLIDNNLNVSEGLKLINNALELDPNNGNFLDIKGWGLYRQHKYNDALKLLEEAYQMIPSFEIMAHIDSVKGAIIKHN